MFGENTTYGASCLSPQNPGLILSYHHFKISYSNVLAGPLSPRCARGMLLVQPSYICAGSQDGAHSALFLSCSKEHIASNPTDPSGPVLVVRAVNSLLPALLHFPLTGLGYNVAFSVLARFYREVVPSIGRDSMRIKVDIKHFPSDFC